MANLQKGKITKWQMLQNSEYQKLANLQKKMNKYVLK